MAAYWSQGKLAKSVVKQEKIKDIFSIKKSGEHTRATLTVGKGKTPTTFKVGKQATSKKASFLEGSLDRAKSIVGYFSANKDTASKYQLSLSVLLSIRGAQGSGQKDLDASVYKTSDPLMTS